MEQLSKLKTFQEKIKFKRNFHFVVCFGTLKHKKPFVKGRADKTRRRIIIQTKKTKTKNG